jgi:hypothetical protein
VTATVVTVPEALPERDGVLVFLTSHCSTCLLWWRALAAEPATSEVIVVTPDPSLESRRAVARLAAPLSVPVVMSSATWSVHRVRQAPWYLLRRGGRTVAAASAPSWELARAALGSV